jgi:hypothetical protein
MKTYAINFFGFFGAVILTKFPDALSEFPDARTPVSAFFVEDPVKRLYRKSIFCENPFYLFVQSRGFL